MSELVSEFVAWLRALYSEVMTPLMAFLHEVFSPEITEIQVVMVITFTLLFLLVAILNAIDSHRS